MKACHHPHIVAFLEAIQATGKWSTARTYDSTLAHLSDWLDDQDIAVDRATTDDLARFQRWLANGYLTADGKPLAKSTQGGVMAAVRMAYRWMRRRGLILHDPAAKLTVTKVLKSLTVTKDHLSQQEAVALIETLGALVDETSPGSLARTRAVRDLALICLALSNGRRCQGLLALKVEHLDLERGELRVEHEKGKTGRVLPVAPWAIAAVKRYLVEARPSLLRQGSSELLFLSQRGDLSHSTYADILDRAVGETIRRNPDLVDLKKKRITTHSLRVTFAHLLFQGGCHIRSVNELMLHSCLSTTALYTPVTTQDLRRALLVAHPRA